ncbi:hypothetical protein AU193_03780 [Mycobacterium sp. GA-1285]|uniref:hypothetical protein n=1 Tax=Mycobacterium sp. GA-1285 TaxID=1772282 RepID=UPI0007469FD0|nr:hypothetical protein [Mycobacterium sp. GA-1285]KUI21516.1 hypothetical protein AU193_03780 [Mycobacterium sp. GA-1285]
MTVTRTSGAAIKCRTRFAGAALLFATGAITTAAFIGAAPAGADPQQPVGPTVVVAENTTSGTPGPPPTQDTAKLSRNHTQAMKDVLKKVQ